MEQRKTNNLITLKKLLVATEVNFTGGLCNAKNEFYFLHKFNMGRGC